MTTPQDALKEYGLGDREIAIYLACIGRNPLSAQEIAERTGMSRQVVYDHVRRLVADGLIVTSRTSNATRYQAADPRRLISNVERKASLLAEALPRLERMRQFDTVLSTAQTHTGTAALRNLLAEALTSGAELLWMTDHTQAHEVFLPHEFHNLTRKRIASRTPIKTLIGSTPIATDELAIWKTDARDLRETRTSPLIDGVGTTTIIYADRIIMMSMDVSSPQAVAITNALLAQTQRRLFLNLWQNAKSL